MSQSAKIAARPPSETKGEHELPAFRDLGPVLGIEGIRPNSQRKAAKDRKEREALTRRLQVSNPTTEHYPNLRNWPATAGVSNSGCHIAFRVRFNRELNHVQQA